MVVVFVTLELSTVTAFKLTVRETELLVGAVYVTEVGVTFVRVPQPLPAHAVPVSVQVTP